MNTTENLSMKYHNFYTIANFVFSVILIFAAIVSAFDTLSALAVLPLFIYELLMSIFLYKKKKAGNIMRQIYNVFNIITSSIEIEIGMFLTTIGLICSSILNELGTPIERFGEFVFAFTAISGSVLLVIGIAIIFVAIGTIILNVLTLKYYDILHHFKWWFQLRTTLMV